MTYFAWLLVALATPAGSPDWDRFRGPNGTGVSTDQAVPVRWTDREGIVFKVPVPGVGNSSPIVCRGSVFVQSAAVDGTARHLLAFDAATGRQRWAGTVPGARARIHPQNTLASSTPASDGSRVYCVFWDGERLGLYAFDFAGSRQWKADLGPFASQHGAAASPVVYGGRVFVADDQDGTAAVVAFDAASGREVWRAERRGFRACYSTPFLHDEPDGERRLVVASTAGITAYDVRDGRVAWNWPWTFSRLPLRTVGSPVAGSGLIFANAGDGGGDRHTVAVKPGGRERPAWEIKKTLPYVPTLLHWGEWLFFVNDGGLAGCLSARTGDFLWTRRLGVGAMASPIAVNGKIYVASEAGDVYVFRASARYEPVATSSVGEPVTATPAVAGGRLYIRGREHLICIGSTAGRDR